jgi:phage FluMu protein Com
MNDIRCPRCGSLMGRADGKAQFRCHKARCFAIVNVDTGSGEMEMIRYGGGPNVRHTNEKFKIADITQKHADGYYKAIRY